MSTFLDTLEPFIATCATSERAVSRRSFIKTAALALGAAAAGAALPGCSTDHTSDELNTTTLFAFDTVITLSAYCDDETLQAAADRCEFFENAFSRTVEGSDIWNINEAGGESVRVNEETADIIEQALAYSKATDGLFDITIGAVSSLWDFVEGVKPDDEDIQAALAHVDWKGVKVDGTTVTLDDPDAKLDLGGIAKGYIADDLVDLFVDAGIESAVINLGGNVAVLGRKPDGSKWNVGIQDPNGSADDVIAAVKAANASVVTSGLYERQFEQDGTTYYHILDPATGYPVETDLVSSSIVTDKSIDGDAYATVLFLLGHDAALDLIEGDSRLEGLLVDEDGNMSQSSGAGFTEYE